MMTLAQNMKKTEFGSISQLELNIRKVAMVEKFLDFSLDSFKCFRITMNLPSTKENKRSFCQSFSFLIYLRWSSPFLLCVS